MGRGRALGSCSPGAAVVNAGFNGGCQTVGIDLEVGSDEYFDHMGSSAHFKVCDGGSARFKL